MKNENIKPIRVVCQNTLNLALAQAKRRWSNHKDDKGGLKITLPTCYHCIYFPVCGDPARTKPCEGKVTEEEDKAKYKEMYRDLKGMLYGDVNHSASGIISDSKIAELLRVTVDKATEIRTKIVHYGISERQGGGLVV